MKSLRAQLLLGMTLGMTVVLLVCGALLYALISRTLWAEFDEALAAKARSLAALTEQDEEGLDFEPAETLLPEFAALQRAEYYQVWRPDGTVLARSPSLQDRNLDRLASAYDAPAFQTVQLPDGRAGRIVGLTFVPRQEYAGPHAKPTMMVTLVVGREIGGLAGTLTRVRRILIGVCLVAVLCSAGVLAWVVRRSLQPVNRLSRQIADLGESDLSARIDAAGVPSEMSPVVDRLNDLLARLESAFQRERRFTGDVAHELRNPLAGLRSKLELALSRDRAPQEYRKAVGDCLHINLQMQRLVENLLQLARADAGQLELRRDQVDLSELIRECWKPLEEKAATRGLKIEWGLREYDALATDRDKLRLVVQNILDNAITYVNDEGRIFMATSAENGALVLSVSNTGSRLPPDDVHRVFDRFWRADSSHHAAGDCHCGLGLPLCKAVVEQLGGSIAASAGVAGVFTITIRLPLQSSSPKADSRLS